MLIFAPSTGAPVSGCARVTPPPPPPHRAAACVLLGKASSSGIAPPGPGLASVEATLVLGLGAALPEGDAALEVQQRVFHLRRKRAEKRERTLGSRKRRRAAPPPPPPSGLPDRAARLRT